MKEEYQEIIYNWVKENFGESEADDPSWDIEALASEIAEKISKPKLYEAEADAHDFMKGWHSLKEWAEFGFNTVMYDGKMYWDGLLNGEDENYEDVENLVCDDYDEDGDGYITVYLEKGKR